MTTNKKEDNSLTPRPSFVTCQNSITIYNKSREILHFPSFGLTRDKRVFLGRNNFVKANIIQKKEPGGVAGLLNHVVEGSLSIAAVGKVAERESLPCHCHCFWWRA